MKQEPTGASHRLAGGIPAFQGREDVKAPNSSARARCDDPSGAYVIDTSRPIDGCSSHTGISVAEEAARRVSRNGGSARILLRDTATGVETEMKRYEPYEVAMEGLVHDS